MTVNRGSLDFDVLIIGAGPVGASLALALDGHGARVGLVEARPLLEPDGDSGQPSYDDKALALSLASVRVLETLGLWRELAGEAAGIRSVHVSQRGLLGRARLTAAEAGEDSLGQVVPARTLGAVLTGALRRSKGVELLCPAHLEGIAPGDAASRVTVTGKDGSRELSVGLVAGTDGTRSRVAELLGLKRRETEYGHLALAANVTPEQPHGGRAFERFTPEGTVALLPMAGQRMGLVWTGREALVEELAALPDGALLDRVATALGHRLGRFARIGARKTYPLAGSRAERVTARRAVLLGNAAQTLHPVAAQGFNLGLRDAATLAELVLEAVAADGDAGDEAVLSRYAVMRAPDVRGTRMLTHGLVRLFEPAFAPVAHARGLGLMALDVLPGVKRAFARRAMGLNGTVPRLVRGLPAAPDAP